VLPAAKPQWTARKGALQLYETFKSIGLNAGDFEGVRYQRVAQLKSLLAAKELGSDLRWSRG
jgi:hypothetical protein